MCVEGQCLGGDDTGLKLRLLGPMAKCNSPLRGASDWTVSQSKLKDICRNTRIISSHQDKSPNAWHLIRNKWASQEKSNSNEENQPIETPRNDTMTELVDKDTNSFRFILSKKAEEWLSTSGENMGDV